MIMGVSKTLSLALVSSVEGRTSGYYNYVKKWENRGKEDK